MSDATLPGRPSFERPPGRRHGTLWLRPDHGGPDEDPTPLYVLGETNSDRLDLIDLDVDDLRWLQEVLPKAIAAMGGER